MMKDILLIENDQLSADSYLGLLDDLKDHVNVAVGGSSAYKALTKLTSYKLIVIDPLLDDSVLEVIHARLMVAKYNFNIGILVVTSISESEYVKSHDFNLFDHFIVKPVIDSELTDAIKQEYSKALYH